MEQTKRLTGAGCNECVCEETDFKATLGGEVIVFSGSELVKNGNIILSDGMEEPTCAGKGNWGAGTVPHLRELGGRNQD